MLTIAILGSGRVASALAGRLQSAGRDFVIGILNPEKPSDHWTGPQVEFTTTAAAIAAADMVFNATPGETSVDFLKGFKDQLVGKILVDVSNAMRRNEDGMPVGLLYPDSSVAEHLQAALPQTAVVKTLNTMLFTVIGDPHSIEPMPNVFLCGDSAAAKAEVRQVLQAMGWRDAVIEDLGPAFSARGPEAFMHFVPHVIANHGFAPFALSIVR
ncbi:NADPH-dependent F420 reductase [Saccharospirillum mangrovi]|uniref:NADPH-dependent F420 reductase n=1 Tax=Saccharospirillum mangrovi TaxID=2161747 RepID=UPI000D3A6272|nr:NAD(P)-binding domain-containing protein [Saccharospirillum mangrovi]